MAIYSGFSHKKWRFSIVMLVYQRVNNQVIPSGTPEKKRNRCGKLRAFPGKMIYCHGVPHLYAHKGTLWLLKIANYGKLSIYMINMMIYRLNMVIHPQVIQQFANWMGHGVHSFQNQGRARVFIAFIFPLFTITTSHYCDILLYKHHMLLNGIKHLYARSFINVIHFDHKFRLCHIPRFTLW